MTVKTEFVNPPNKNNLERPLPHSKEAERALLGGILLGGDGPWLDASEFHLPFHQSLCQALHRLRKEGKPTNDLVLLHDALSPAEVEACGGIAYIASLVDGIPRVSNLQHYAETIKRDALTRRAIALNSAMGEKLWHANGNASDVHREVSALAASLSTSLRGNGSSLSPVLKEVSVTELLHMDVKAREMVLHPFLPSQGLTMLYSKRGAGKTYISLGIAVAVAGGGAFLKWNAPKARKVLFVDGEMPCASLKQRVCDIVAGTDIAQPLDNLRLITPDLQDRGLPDLATAEGQELIEEHLGGVELLVLDNLSCLVRESKENEGDSWVPIAGWALDLRRRGISVLFVHHSGKAGDQRGTSRREDLLDSVVELKHPSDYAPSEGLRVEVCYKKSRGFYGDEAKPFEVKLTTGPSGEAVWTMANPDASFEDRVLEMHNKLGMSCREIAAETGKGSSTIHRIVKGRVPVSQPIGA